MKKTVAFLIIFATVLSFGVSALQAGYLPNHTEANVTVSEKTKRINAIVDNTDAETEELVYGILVASAIAEDTDFYLYTLAGELPVIKIEHTKECIDNIMKNYAKPQTTPKEVAAYISAINDLEFDASHTEKNLEFFMGNSYIDDDALFNQFYDTIVNFSHIGYKIYGWDIGMGRHWEELNKHKVSSAYTSSTIESYFLGLYGYERMPGSYYSYDDKAGTVTIDSGKADANILIKAYSRKADLLYISGYMAPGEIYEEQKNKKEIKGVSLGYNFINVEKTQSPKNVAYGLFSIDENVYDVNSTSFVIPVKNAESVELFYKSDMGMGVSGKTAKYNRSQDDSIKNMNAPQEVSTEKNEAGTIEEAIGSIINKTQKEQSGNIYKDTNKENGVWKVVKNILLFIWNLFLMLLALAWSLFRLALIVCIILMIVNKNVRKNFTSRIMNSKLGPIIEKIVFKLRLLWANITKTDPPIMGAEKEDVNCVFISHSSKDRAIPNNRIETVVRELESRNIKCWISNKNIKTGKVYSGEIVKAIENSSIFVVFLSETAAASEEVAREMTLATSNHKEIFPVLIEDFDVFKYDNWKYWLSITQFTPIFDNKAAKIKEFADEIENTYKRYVPDYSLKANNPQEEVTK